MAISPYAVGLEPGDPVWVTVIECGMPVWKKGTTVRPVNSESGRSRVRVEGRDVEVQQHDVMSFSCLRTRTS